MSVTAESDRDNPDYGVQKFEQIVGVSSALEAVFQAVELVAPTDSTVLIQGETGTGKELIARAIHKISPRCNQPFVTVNCAAIPSDLLESELFGYERGAFTGAFARKVGRFETANQGTLFLDEIGELRPEIQPKLLRILQEQEFERLGSTRTQHVNVRLIAATNRDLARMVELNQFRGELFYRLNIFPIYLVPLRERREDILPLVHYFVERFSRRMKRQIHSIPQETIMALLAYDWPGNIRELQNMIERAVIFSTEGTLRNPFKLGTATEVRLSGETATLQHSLESAERNIILQALHRANWVIGGSSGAASMLGLKRTGLIYKMKRLGISRLNVEDPAFDDRKEASERRTTAGPRTYAGREPAMAGDPLEL